MNDDVYTAGQEPPPVCQQCGSRFCGHEQPLPKTIESVELSIAAEKAETVRDFVALMLEDLEEGRLSPDEALALQKRMAKAVAETRAMLDVMYFEADRMKSVVRRNKPLIVAFASFAFLFDFLFDFHLTLLLQL